MDDGFRDRFLEVLRTTATASKSVEVGTAADGLADICKAMDKI